MAGSRGAKKIPELALVLAWLLPGGGHFYIGQTKKAILFLVIIFALFFAGVGFARGRNVSVRYHKFAFAAQACIGPAGIATGIVTRDFEQTTDDMAWFDAGMLYSCVAGLLNLLVIMDAVGESRHLSRKG